jgi:phosphatidylglycerol:prolipoprotein diacylglycerol transferase
MHPELFRIPGINLTVPSYGVIVMISFLAATWWTARRCMRVKVDPDIALNLGLISLIASMVGARAFYVIHYWESQFAHDPKQILNLPAGGAELYGGLIGAFIACVLNLLIKRASIRLWARLDHPGPLAGKWHRRIGCFAVGCCGRTLLPEAPLGGPLPVRQPASPATMGRPTRHRPRPSIFSNPAAEEPSSPNSP